jgi:hypothetical protein
MRIDTFIEEHYINTNKVLLFTGNIRIKDESFIYSLSYEFDPIFSCSKLDRKYI